MAFRVVVRPWADNCEENVYDVEELMEMLLADGTVAQYWSFVETLHTFERAEEYVHALALRREVVKEYN
jgi:hypothetical protein